MTAKDKAKELVDKYMNSNNMIFLIEGAKECALIAVDEILLIKKEIWDDFHSEYFDFFIEVKREIEKL